MNTFCKGSTLYLSFLIMTVLLGVALGVSTLLVSQLGALRGIGYSVTALYAADTGIEKVLFIDTVITQCKDNNEDDESGHNACIG